MSETKKVKGYRDKGFVSIKTDNISEQVEELEHGSEVFSNKSRLLPTVIRPVSSLLYFEEVEIDDSDIKSTRKPDKYKPITRKQRYMVYVHKFIQNSHFLSKLRTKFLQWRKNVSK